MGAAIGLDIMGRAVYILYMTQSFVLNLEHKLMNLKKICLCIFCFGLLLLSPLRARAETVRFPFFVDFPLLRTLVINSVFDGPNQRAEVLNNHNGCQQITLSDPSFHEKDALVSLETEFHTHIGAFFGGKCRLPVEYTGRLSVLLQPIIDSAWTFSFRLERLNFLDRQGNPLKLSRAAAPLLKSYLSKYLEDFAYDLRPSIQEVKSFIMPLVPTPYRHRAQQMLQSMRPGNITTSARGLRVEILADAEVVYEAETEPQPLAASELKAVVHTWEALDEFLVQLITSLTVTPLSDSAKHGLMSALLESRYDFVIQWSEGRLRNDFVREQFKAIWINISDILRDHLSREPAESALRHLAFYTASEALSILDKIGPSFGIEISRAGLLRMARLLTGDTSLKLMYQSTVNPELRAVFGLGEMPPPAPSVEDGPDLELGFVPRPIPKSTIRSFFRHLQNRFPGLVWAQDKEREITVSEMKSWIFQPGHLDAHLAKVRGLLEEAYHRVMNSKASSQAETFFSNLIPAIAWQESCFRQFIVKEGKITVLRSYNGTSVGLMQINERVWRGIYNAHALKWDIHYNAQAGCEIAHLYLKRYAWTKFEDSLETDTLARLVYALYNGGPSQLSQFMKRHQANDYFRSDKLFYEKYLWVVKGAWKNLRRCLVGG